MKKKLIGILTATLLMFSTAAVVIPATQASAVTLQYKCQRYDWFFGWRTRYTTDYNYVRQLQADGWTCYCIASYP